MDFTKIKAAAEQYEQDMTKFLRDLVRIPGESCEEKGHIDRIAEEMRKVGFDKVEIDPMGNILGYMGTGSTLIAYDAHIDNVGIDEGNGDSCHGWRLDGVTSPRIGAAGWQPARGVVWESSGQVSHCRRGRVW